MKELSSSLIRQADSERMRVNGVPQRVYALIYRAGAPWSIGRPQWQVERWERAGLFRGVVCDVGCGLGDNAFFIASNHHSVTAIDYIEEVIEKALRDTRLRSLPVRFLKADILDLGDGVGPFDTVLDSATFHGFSDAQRERYVRVLSSLISPGGRLLLLGISDRERRSGGPRRLSTRTIRTAFDPRVWSIVSLQRTLYNVEGFEGGAEAIAAEIVRN